MKKNVGLFSTVCLTLLLLTACNTEEEPQQGMEEPANEEITPTEEINKDEKTETNEKVNEPKETEGQLNPAKTKENEVTNDITYSTNGDEITEETTTVDSNNYSLQLIPGFTLTPEEPGKDMLYFEENDKISMRIETIPATQATYDDIVANTEETVAAIGEYEPFPIDQYIGNHSEISKAIAYTVTFETEKIVMIVFEKGDIIVRLTVYDDTSVDLTDAMVKMGLTIQSK